MRRICAVLLVICLFCTGCFYDDEIRHDDIMVSDAESDGDGGDVVSEDISTPEPTSSVAPVKEPSAIKKLSEETGLREIWVAIEEQNNWYTITFQQDFLGNTYLLEDWAFDIYLKDNQIWLKSSGGYEEIYLIALTECQCDAILDYEQYTDFAFAIEITGVEPINATYRSDGDYDIGQDIEVYTHIYIEADSYKLVYGSCQSVYVLNYDESQYEKIA